MQIEYIYGMHAVKAVLQNRPQIVKTLYLPNKKNEMFEIASNLNISIKLLSKSELDSLLPNANHQGIAAEILADSNLTYNELDLQIFLDNIVGQPFLLILDGVQDPHNLGACMRVANASGVHAVIVPKDRAVSLTPTVHKVASGASLVTPLFQITNLARTIKMLKDHDFWIYGCDAEATTSIYKTDFKGKIAIVLGSEHDGLRRLTRELCDFLVSIPMFGTVSSLNVGVAAGICLFEAVRQRI